MRLGPLRARIGVISSEDDSLNLLSLSFMILAFRAIISSDGFVIRIHAGSRICEDTFAVDEGSVRVYGERASATGFAGKDVKLFATEDTVEINVLDADTGKLLGCFRYKHLEPAEVSNETDLASVDYSDEIALKSIEGVFNDENSLPPTPAMAAQADASATGRKRVFDEVDTDEEESEDDDITITHTKTTPRGHGLLAPSAESNLTTPEAKFRRSIPSSASTKGTPLRQSKLSRTFTPAAKATNSTNRSISNVKAEDNELKPMPKFEPSPSLQLLKDSQRKVAGLDGQIDKDELELDGLEEKRLVKINRGKANYEKALLKADREYAADKARIEEKIEQAFSRRQEEVKKQEWLQTKAMENVDVIELSDDSASESGTVSSDDE